MNSMLGTSCANYTRQLVFQTAILLYVCDYVRYLRCVSSGNTGSLACHWVEGCREDVTGGVVIIALKINIRMATNPAPVKTIV